jgi:tetratricopeptide (TPR) repeat protein
MSPDDDGPLEAPFAELLAACDEIVATGSSPSIAAGSIAPELRERLERDVSCLRYIERAWPRRAAEPLAAGGAAVSVSDLTELPWANVGRFRLVRELGAGAFGRVFLAFDPELGREVALKVPWAEGPPTLEMRGRLRREAMAAAGLCHPNLVPVFEADQAGSIPYIASAYCPGVTLAAWLKDQDQPVPWRDAAALIATLADAVQHAHDRGVLHRDLKPANILLQDDGGMFPGCAERPAQASSSRRLPALGSLSPRITDFGLAKFLDGDGAATQSGALVGTPSYMAPEQAAGRGREVGPAADVYSLGTILYELLTGRPPFRADGVLDLMDQVRTQEPVAPSRLRPRLSPDLETITLKCLEKEPERRYATARALAEDLRRSLDGQPIQARPIAAHRRWMRWAYKRPAIVVFLGMLIVSVVGAAAGSIWHVARLREQNVQLERQRALEKRIRTVAMDVLVKLVFDVQRDLRDAPGMEATEEKVLRTAVDGLQRVLGEGQAAGLDVEGDHAMAVARTRLGRIYLALAQYGRAQAAFEEVRRTLGGQAGADRRSALDLAQAVLGLGTSLARQDKAADAERCLREAVRLAGGVLAAEPADLGARECLMNASNDLGDLDRERFSNVGAAAWYRRSVGLGSALANALETIMARRELGYAWMRLGELGFMAGDPSEGWRSLGRALELRRSLVRESGQSSWASLDLAVTLRALARGEQLAGQDGAARAHFLEALGMLETQRAANPRWVRVQRQVSNLFCLLGEVATAQGDVQTARSSYLRAAEVFEALLRRSDRHVRPVELANCYRELGWFEAAVLNPEAVLKWTGRALSVLERLGQDERPDDRAELARIREEILHERAHAREVVDAKESWSSAVARTDPTSPNILAIRAEAAACLGRHADAATLAQVLADRGRTDAEAWYRIGVLYVRCRSAVGVGRSRAELSPGDRALQDRYAALAISMLDRAIRHGFADRNRLQEDLNLVSLRPYPGFRVLFQQAHPPTAKGPSASARGTARM